MKKFWRILALAGLVAAPVLTSCKKDEEKETKFLSGTMTLTLPQFLEPGYTKTFNIDTLMTMRRDDGGKVGYVFMDPFATTNKYDTLVTDKGVVRHNTFTLTVKDSLATFDLILMAYGGEYYGASQAASFTVIRPGLNGDKSLTGFDIKAEDKTFTDARDGNTYYYSKIGNTEWMRQNLAWQGAGVPFKEAPVMSTVMGQFYNWNEAKTACPEGWTLPSEDDWIEMAASLGITAKAFEPIPGLSGLLMENLYLNKDRLWEYFREVKISNEARFSAIPAGYATAGGGKYNFTGGIRYSVFWTSTELNGEALYRYILQGNPDTYCALGVKDSFMAPVRCIRKP